MFENSSKFKIFNLKDTEGKPLSLEVTAGLISKITNEEGASLDSSERIQLIDGLGKTVISGLVDLHTHLREPGNEDSETVLTGSQAAVAGGFCAVSAMANSFPVADTAGVVEQVFRLGQSHGICDVFPIGAITVGLKGKQLSEMTAMQRSEARTRIFSDDGKCLSNALVMRRALEYVKIFDGVIAQHAQDPLLTADSQMNEGLVSAKLGLKGWPAVAEEAIIARDILLAEHVQSRLHICHVSTAGSVEIIRWAKNRGFQVTCEVTPHHLLLTEDLVESYNPIFKVNPPLRTKSDVEALRQGVADGTIDVIATDHAPHPKESKDCEWPAAAFGMTGLETALSVSYKSLVENKILNLSQLIQIMSEKPARIGKYEQHGELKVGKEANFALVDLSKSWSPQRGSGYSKSQNNPFMDYQLPVVVEETYLRGKMVFRRDAQ
jgi:dihydroorotase